MKQLAVFLALAGFVAPTFAKFEVCRHGDKMRIISVEYEKRGQDVPCRVKYQKAEGTTYPWNAQNTEGYCEEKAKMLVERHEDEWGWKCKRERRAPRMN